MHKYLAVAALCIALQLGSATRVDDIKWCLHNEELKDTDRAFLDAIGDPGEADKLKDAPKDKLNNVMTCAFHQDIDTKKSLHDVYKNLMNADDKLPEDQKKQMMDTLSDCKTKANGDDAKLLQCMKATDEPFAKYSTIILNLPPMAHDCFIEHGLKTSDLFAVRNMNREGPDVFKRVDEDKFACGLGCIFDTERRNHPQIKESLIERINLIVEKHPKLAAEKKASMLETANKCNTEAAGDSCKYVKCIKLLQAPFADVFFMNAA